MKGKKVSLNNKELKIIEKKLNGLNLHFVDFDVFSVLNIKQMEIRHSRMISFLLDPNAEHKSKSFLDGLYKYLGLKYKTIKTKSISVVCEIEKNIDIFIKDSFNKIIIVIENKINSKQHSNQLKKYYEHVKYKYVKKLGYKCKFVYLCKNDDEDIDNTWERVSYETLFDRILFKNKVKCNNNSVKKFIEDYKYIFLREFNMATKENEKKKVLELYKKYKDTFDVIYKYADNEGLLDKSTYLQWIQDVLEELEQKKLVKYKPDLRNVDISFFTKQLDGYFQPAPKDKEWGAWGKGVAYFYWFHRINDGEDYEIVFELGGVNKKNKNDKLNNKKELLKKIKNAFDHVKCAYFEDKQKLHPKKGINKKVMGQFNQMYSYRIKAFNSMNKVKFKEEVEKGIRSMIAFENKWFKKL